jgi:hypothetical protein
MFKFYRSVLAAGVVALGLAACGDNVTVQPPPPPGSGGVTSVTVTPANITIGVGQTEQLALNVVADSGADKTVNWTTGNAAVATVSDAGVVTGVGLGSTSIIATSRANSSISGAAQVTVSNAATFAITPNTLNLAPGQSSNVVATAVLQAGQTASPIVWSSLTPSVATVASGCTTAAGSSTCAITGVSQGSAVITAATTVGGQNLTTTLAVTVGQGASISIQSVTASAGQPGAGLPVILTNVTGQIDVNMNLNAGTQPLDSLNVSIKSGAGFKRVAQQLYGGSIPSTGPVTLSVNTANFTKDTAKGTAIVDLFNGPTSLSVQVFPHLGAGGTVINCQTGANDPSCAGINSMILNNIDGWAADISKCSGSLAPVICPAANPAAGTGGFATDSGGATPNLGKTYWGGPGATGEITAQLYAVVYNDNPAFPPGSTLNRCKNQLGDGTACISKVTWTLGSSQVPSGGDCPFVQESGTDSMPAPLFRQVFGSTGPDVTDNCTGVNNIFSRRDNIIIEPGALDAQSNSFPSGGMLISNITVFGATPDSLRIDWKGPNGVATPAVVGAEGFNWVNALFAFTPSGTLATDQGVGPAPGFTIFASANGGSLLTFPTAVVTGADLPETNQNCTGVGCDGFNLRATATDRLGNPSNSAVSAAFGVDKTAPLVRYSTHATYAAIYDSGGTAAVMDSTTYWAIEGTYGANVVTPGAQVRFLSPAQIVSGLAATNDRFRIEALDNRSGLSRAVEKTINFSQAGAPCGTAGGCTTVSSLTTAVFLAATTDGWRPAQPFNVLLGADTLTAPPATPGYFTTTGYVVDRAGNVSGCPVTGNIAGTVVGTVASICTAAAPSVTAGTNSATGVVGANEFFRRTLALDPAQPVVTGVSPNALFTANDSAMFTLGAQNDLEVIDARLSIQYPNVTIGDAAGTLSSGGGLVNFGATVPVATRFDASIVNPILAQVPLDMFTVNIQETCTGGAGGIGRPATGPAGTTCATAPLSAGDPIPAADIPFAKPTNVAVQVRDVFGSFIKNTTAGANTGVSAQLSSPILSATVPAPGGYSVTYDATALCPQGGVVGGACVIAGINFRADGIAGSTYNFRATEPLSTSLPTFVRVDLFGLNASNQWVFIQRCTVPASISPNTGAQGCGGGTVTGTDNGLERYWEYSFTSVPTTGFTEFRALGVNASGFGLFSTVQP